jgi:protein subunit release factor A
VHLSGLGRRFLVEGPPASLEIPGLEVLMSNVIVEIRAAEGGDDAKLLVTEQFRIYGRLGSRRRL